jgi:hypothetical protein
LQPKVCNILNYLNSSPHMEHSPITPNATIESDAKTSESGKDKKDRKKSKAIGSLAFERTEPKANKADKYSTTHEPAFKLFESSEKSNDEIDNVVVVPEAADVVDADMEKQTDQSEMSAEDRLYAARQIALERQTELASELPGEDSESEVASLAAQEFYDKIISDNQQPEVAATTVLAEIDAGDTSSITSEETDGEIAADATSLHWATPPAGGSSGGNGNAPPPLNQRAPGSTAPQPPPNPNLAPITPNLNGATPNLAPSTAPNLALSLNQNQPNYAPYYNGYNRSRAGSDLLVGGIVGYLIGRRRGRLKTEGKLLPVQHKLEREVSGLQKIIDEKESIIRQAATSRAREQQPGPAKTVVLRGEKASAETVILNRRETQSERPRNLDRPISAPEIHGQRVSPPPERIGHVLVAAEMIDAHSTRSEKSDASEVTALKDLRNVERQVETLSRNELLTLSEKVIVEGSTLRQVYETQLISERGLRRLISEYLRGGDVLKAFRRELVEREIDFERDPKLRDKVRQGLRGGGASPTLHKLLEQAGVAPIDESRQSIAEARAQQLYDAKQQAKQKSHRKVMDLSLITVIAVLLAVIIVLAIHKM